MMKKSIITGAVMMGLSVIAPGVSQAAPQVVQPGTMIRGDLIEYGCTVSATGKLPDGSKAVLTAGHCIGDSNSNKGHLGKKVYTEYEDTRPIGVSVYSENKMNSKTNVDVAVIKLDKSVKVIPQKNGYNTQYKVGDKISKSGRVTGVTSGNITKVDSRWITATNNGFYGDSGAPAFDTKGRLIGQLSKLDADSAKVNGVQLPWTPEAGTVFQRIELVINRAYEKTGFVAD